MTSFFKTKKSWRWHPLPSDYYADYESFDKRNTKNISTIHYSQRNCGDVFFIFALRYLKHVAIVVYIHHSYVVNRRCLPMSILINDYLFVNKNVSLWLLASIIINFKVIFEHQYDFSLNDLWSKFVRLILLFYLYKHSFSIDIY